jgi:hypothetical protein
LEVANPIPNASEARPMSKAGRLKGTPGVLTEPQKTSKAKPLQNTKNMPTRFLIGIGAARRAKA